MSDPGLDAINVVHLGRVEYEDGLVLQERFFKARQQGLIGDVLLLLEHSPVLTLGRAAKPANILLPRPALQKMGFEVFETNRGGDVTYHGPGQLVGYPIFKLDGARQDVRRYVRDLEEALIRTVAKWGITAGRIPKLTGVWLGDETSPDARKIAAIGVHIARWITSHGFALNVNTDLSHFRVIVPCGIQEKGVTSIAAEIGREVPLAEVESEVASHFAALFGKPLRHLWPERRTISVAVTKGQGDDAKVLLLKRTPERGGFWQLVTGTVESGETPNAAAAREVREETGRALEVRPLDYVHAFAFGETTPPGLVEETAFAAAWPDDAPVSIDPREHTELAWVSVAEAMERLPFAGLRIASRRALVR
ncbi:MAG: lipoyl(octanoyl) transferase LipB [Myxococcaceae bacterium]|nr:lipoyl(octanoyl) transferase LipB [Myxococcaceae bacterium]